VAYPPNGSGERAWCYGAQSHRPFGTAAEFTVVPLDHIAALPENVSPEQGACLGIPGITAHRALHVGGDVMGRTVLVQGAGGAVGMCAVALARHAAARVIGTVRPPSEEPAARRAGAHEVILNDQGLVERVKALVPEGLDHVVEVAFGANIDADIETLKMGGSIGAYATDNATPKIPFWLMVFKNTRVFFLGERRFPCGSQSLCNARFERGPAGWMDWVRDRREDSPCGDRTGARIGGASGAA